jgi:hypothetical protein
MTSQEGLSSMELIIACMMFSTSPSLEVKFTRITGFTIRIFNYDVVRCRLAE